MRILVLFLLAGTLGAAQHEFDAVRKKALWHDQEGTLRVGPSNVCFTPKEDGETPRCWKYEDIQYLDRVRPTELMLLTYEDVAWKLGRDRSYRFELLSGELSDQLFERMIEDVGKPATDRVVQEISAAQREIPVKHLKPLGGSEGSIHISAERIVYLTDAQEQSRKWSLGREVASVWSSDPYRLEIHVFEGNAGAFRQPKVYKFALKRPLDAELYRRLKLRIYRIDRERDLTP